mmetsp:Transcript_97598/g.172847  ORF Transcript_97598/g.172847 Transcript_97598/m.172847 type:complete len:423 (-) Transcript_97598:13-1281(-)
MARCLHLSLFLSLAICEASDFKHQASEECNASEFKFQADRSKDVVSASDSSMPHDEVSLLQSVMQVEGEQRYVSRTESLTRAATGKDIKQSLQSSYASEQRKVHHMNIFHRGAYASHQLLSWATFFTFARMAPGIFIGLCVLELTLLLGRNYRSKAKMASNPWQLRYIMFLCLLIVGGTIAYAYWLISLTYRVEFIHIPKNAGTSVEVAGEAGGIAWAQKMFALSTKQVMPDGHSLCSMYHVPHFMNQYSIPYKDLTTVCITRHPFSRMVSEYDYLLSWKNQIAEVGHPWGHRYDELYGIELYKYPRCSKMGLNHFTQTVLKLIKSGNFYINDCHHIPQVKYIWDPSGEQQCSDIIRIDDLPGAFDAIMEREGYGVRMTEEANEAKACPDLSNDMLDDQSLQMLAEVYADDLKFLNYSATVY